MDLNIFLIIIIFTLTAEYLLEIILNYLTIKSLTPHLPSEFKGYYEEEAYKKSQDYSKAKVKFSYLTTTFSYIFIMTLILAGLFDPLDKFARSFHYPPIFTGCIFIGTLAILSDIFSTPFELYNTFIIEERFGFNKTTISVYISDKLKGYMLTAVIGGVLLLTLLYLFEFAGTLAWFYCFLAVSLITIMLQFLAPSLILPIFNKFTPLEDGELKEKIEQYAKKTGFNIAGLFVIDGSRRSAKSNAYFTGFGSKKRIALFDTLIQKHSTDELIAILAHEVGHFKKRHVIKMLSYGIIKTGLILYLMSFFIKNRLLFDAFGVEHPSIYASLVFFFFLYAPIELILSVFVNIVSRRYEFEADRFAALTTEKPAAMIEALKNLSVHNLSNLTPHPFDVFINYSHPPVIDRIKAIRATTAL